MLNSYTRPDEAVHTSLGRLCIWQPTPASASETFLDVHARLLPAITTVVYGGNYPRDAKSSVDIHNVCRRLLILGRRFMSSKCGPFIENQLSNSIASYLRRHRFDVVLAEYGFCGLEVAEAAKIAKVPLVVHFHGVDAYAGDPVQRSVQYRAMFKSAAAVVVVSRDMEATIVKLGCPASKVFCVPCGSDANRFSIGTPHSQPARIVAVGRMVEKKAPHLTIVAFAKVLSRYPDATLDMVGDGPLFGPTMQLAKALGISQNIRFLGAQPQAKVAGLLKECRAFVQHSVRANSGDSEGTPVAIVEALTCGIPVVSTRHGGIPDVVVEGETGYLVDEYDVDGMAHRIGLLLEDDDLVSAMSKKARAYALAHLSAEIRIRELSAVIAGAIGQSAQ